MPNESVPQSQDNQLADEDVIVISDDDEDDIREIARQLELEEIEQKLAELESLNTASAKKQEGPRYTDEEVDEMLHTPVKNRPAQGAQQEES